MKPQCCCAKWQLRYHRDRLYVLDLAAGHRMQHLLCTEHPSSKAYLLGPSDWLVASQGRQH